LPFFAGLTLLAAAIARQRTRGRFHLFALVLFGFYLMAAIRIIFFPIPIVDGWPKNLSWEGSLHALQQINWIPFNYRLAYLSPMRLAAVLGEIIANILITLPFGAGMGFLANLGLRRMLGVAVLTGFFLEGAELVIILIVGVHYHVVDINDVFWNALGVMLGFGLFRSGRWIVRHLKKDAGGLE